MRSDEIEWNEYTAPATNMAAAIQFPLDENWNGRVINAYLKDDKIRRKNALASDASSIHLHSD